MRELLRELNQVADPSRLSGMARYGIATDKALGVSVPDLRKLARKVGKDHDLAADLWKTEIHEARLLASMIDEPARLTNSSSRALHSTALRNAYFVRSKRLPQS